MKELKLLVCSDMHGSVEALDMLEREASSQDCDAVIMCGDFTTYGSLDTVSDFLRRFKMRVLAVPGNCDMPDTVAVLERANASVHNMRVLLGEWWVFGFGGGLPSSSQMPFEVDEDIIERSLRSIAAPDGIMVTHTPAYGANDKGRSGHRLGSRAIMRIVNEFRPKLVLSGHVHESPGKEERDGTVFVNPGPAKNGHFAIVRVGAAIDVRLCRESHFGGQRKMF
ncbi:MAG: metallophosphoesterase family protein [Thermoplasmata archaeon]